MLVKLKTRRLLILLLATVILFGSISSIARASEQTEYAGRDDSTNWDSSDVLAFLSIAATVTLAVVNLLVLRRAERQRKKGKIELESQRKKNQIEIEEARKALERAVFIANSQHAVEFEICRSTYGKMYAAFMSALKAFAPDPNLSPAKHKENHSALLKEVGRFECELMSSLPFLESSICEMFLCIFLLLKQLVEEHCAVYIDKELDRSISDTTFQNIQTEINSLKISLQEYLERMSKV